MATQYTPILKLALPVTGELSGTWGDVVNDNITSMIEQAIAGLATINTWTANVHTLTTANGLTSESRCAMLTAADGAGGTALTAAGEIICPASSKLYVLKNGSSYAVTLKTASGTGIAVPAGQTAFLFCDGTNVNACVTTIVDGNISGNLTVNGNTTLGNATSDTITATARFNTDLLPSTDNARDLGTSGNSWRNLYIDGTAYLALVDINGGAIDGVTLGTNSPVTEAQIDNININGNTISSTNTDGNVIIAPNGTGDVQLDADTVRIGDSGAAVTLTSNGAANLTLSTNGGTNSGTIVINNGVNGNIVITPNGTGDVQLDADTVRIGDVNTDTFLTTNGTGNLNLTTNGGTNSGSIQIAQGVNGNITLDPNGTGKVAIDAAFITGGTIDGTVIGGTTAAAGTFTTVNKVTITSPATAATLTIANGKTLTANNSLTLSGTDSTTMTFPATNATIARTDAAQTFTGNQTITGNLVLGTQTNKATLTYTTNTARTLTIPNVGGDRTFAFINEAQTFTAAQTFRAANAVRVEEAATQDAVILAGRAGGTNSYAATITTATLSANVTHTLPAITGTLATLANTAQTFAGAVTVSGALTANGNVTLGDATSDTVTVTGRVNTDLVPSTDNARDLGTSALKWKQVYATTFTENGYGLVSQTDIGSGPNEIPLNQYLGALAYEDTETPALDVGAGIIAGVGTICKANGGLMGGVYRMTILIDLTGLNSGGTAGDIIGVNGTAMPCYIARLPAMTVLGGRMTCLETPAGGDTDIDLYSAAEGTGVEDQAISALTETEIINAGAQTRGTVTYFSADPAANTYFYLVGQGTANTTYTAGRFLIEIFGVQ